MPAKATYIGLDKIISAYTDKAETPFFSAWVGKTRVEQNTQNDFDKAVEKLTNQINDFAEGEFNDVFVIAIHPEKKASYTTSDWKDASLMYCQAKKNVSVGYSGNGTDYAMIELLREIKNDNNEIKSRLSAIESDEINESETDDTTEIGKTESLLNTINGIVNSPIVGLLMQRLFPATQQTTALAGTDDINEILNTLYNKGVTIQHLKKLSEFPKEQIAQLIKFIE